MSILETEGVKIPVPYNYDEIYEVLKKEAIESGYVTDADYEGSNIAEIVRLVSYAVQSCNVNLTKAVNESLITRTSDYTIAFKLAKQLGYIPSGRVSYTYKLILKPKTPGFYSIPKFTEFKSGDKSYYYMGDTIETEFKYNVLDSGESFNALPDDWFNDNGNSVSIPDTLVLRVNSIDYRVFKINKNLDTQITTYYLYMDGNDLSTYLTDTDLLNPVQVIDTSDDTLYVTFTCSSYETHFTEDITVKEGILKTYYDPIYNPDGERDLYVILKNDQYYIDLDYQNVESDGIELYATYFGDNQTIHIKEKFIKRDILLADKTNVIEKRTFVPLILEDTNTLRIYFKYAGTGYVPPVSSKIYMNILISSGKDGIMTEPISYVTLSPDQWDILNLTDGIPDIIINGSDIETLEEIKENAIILNNTASRAVTSNDYKAVARKQELVRDAQCWGGEDDLPVQHLGHIYLSLVPSYEPTEFISLDDFTYLRVIDEKKFNLLSTELRGDIYDVNGDIDYTKFGIIDNIDIYNIISMPIHHINPIYLNIGLNINIERYISTLTRDIQRDNMFNLIKDYFLGNVEYYDKIFFKSNIIRILDEYLGDDSGLDMDISYDIQINAHSMYRPVTFTYAVPQEPGQFIDFYLKMNYGKIKDISSLFNYDLVPWIESEEITLNNGTTGKFYIQKKYSSGAGLVISDDEIIELKMRFGDPTTSVPETDAGDPNTDPIVGAVFINTKTMSVLYRIFVDCYGSIVTEDDINAYQSNSISFSLTNIENTIRTCGNTIPRLSKITFN